MPVDFSRSNWLDEIASANAAGKGRSYRLQRMFCPSILVTRSAVEAGPYELVESNVEYVNAMLQRACLLPGEFPVESLYSYYADFYLTQVKNGGHGQFAHNCNMGDIEIGSTAFGLKLMGAEGHLAILTAFLEIMEGPDRERAAGIQDGAGFDDIHPIDPEVRALDHQFFALDRTHPMLELNAAWLRTLPQLEAVDDAQRESVFETIARSNTHRELREAETARRRDEARQADPRYRLIKRLCKKARRVPREIWPDKTKMVKMVFPDFHVWNVRTDVDELHVVIAEHKRAFGSAYYAALTEVTLVREQKIYASMRITRDEYDLMCPPESRA